MKSVRFVAKKTALLFAALLFVSSAGLFTGCQTDDDAGESFYQLESVPETIVGKWVSDAGDCYEISKETVKVFNNKNDTDPNLVCQKVEIAEISGKENSYYLYGQVKSALTWSYGELSGSYGTVENYKCFYIELVSDSAIKISQGYTTVADVKTLEKAKSEYTLENGAFSIIPEYLKQN